VAQDAPQNVTLVLEPVPFTLTPEATLLPAPPTERHPGRDLTDWFNAAATSESLRIGLAHGSVTHFDSSEEGASSVIAPDRARRAGLNYLGLGDWHGHCKSDRKPGIRAHQKRMASSIPKRPRHYWLRLQEKPHPQR